MSLRTRLALAFFLFSALPLAGFAVYSYITSTQSLRQAAWLEAEDAARELEARVDAASSELGDRFHRLATIPSGAGDRSAAARAQEVEVAMTALAPALPFLDELRFVPSDWQGKAAALPDEGSAKAAERLSESFVRVESPAGAGGPGERGMLSYEQHQKIRHQIEKVREQLELSLQAEIGSMQETAEKRKVLAVLAATQVVIPAFENLVESAVAAGAAESPSPAAAPAPPVPPAATVARVPETPSVPSVDRSDALTRGRLSVRVASGERWVGTIEAQLKASELLASVLEKTDRSRGEIPFALDSSGELYVTSVEDETLLESLPELDAIRNDTPAPGSSDWVLRTYRDASSGYRFGIARPIGGAIAELQRATARNFALGLGLVGLALVGFFPLTRRIVRDVRDLETGAARIAAGDLEARVAVRGRDELGRLAGAFNRMAEQIAGHQVHLIAEERRRKEDEIERRLLAAENERRGRELEEARQFQLALLPRELPAIEGFELAVEMTTATEVGGDYYDFKCSQDGAQVIAIGDATGHGVTAGTLVTAVKSLFATSAAGVPPAAFLTTANAAIHGMGLVRRAMALTVAHVRGNRVRVSAAGMPPVIHFHAKEGNAEEIVLPGMPLGARADSPYAEVELELAPGDTLLFLSDGLPELPNGEGEPFGYERLRLRFAELASGDSAAIVAGLRASAGDWANGQAPVDDVTLLVLKRSG